MAAEAWQREQAWLHARAQEARQRAQEWPQEQLPPPPQQQARQRAQQRAAEEAPPQPWVPPQDPDYTRFFQQQMRWVFNRVESEGGMPPVPPVRRTPMVRESELKGKLVRFLAGMRAFERQRFLNGDWSMVMFFRCFFMFTCCL